ncbi:MAG: hypothetical protein KGL39_12020 [Patescibacteria group bacterium]|nr:hypothetical protein [Patescibacteria group bacterium]
MGIHCFLLEPTDRVRQSLRRFVFGSKGGACSVAKIGIHDASIQIEDGTGRPDEWPHDDPRWPKSCPCGYVFTDSDEWQLFIEPIYVADGQQYTLRSAPPGAMWFADWVDIDRWKGPDGRTLMVMTPGGQWMVDGVASNCTKPNDTEHRCWIRHGTPPSITVDKNGNTCAAGAGSILCGSYHGFLRNGELSPA